MRTMQLLQTKLQRPRVPRQFVPRPRLSERLDQGSEGPLTLVCAAAGYGKTTLVGAWIESLAARNPPATREPVAWISLDERDSDLGIFLRYFVAGLRTMFVDACPATFSLLLATRQPPFDLLCATLINEITCLPQDFILVLDDHHLIGGTAVPDLLVELERHWPPPLHLVLISRHMPALSLDALRAKGRLTEIRRATCGSQRMKPPRIWRTRCGHPSAGPLSNCSNAAPRVGSRAYNWPAWRCGRLRIRKAC